MSLAVEVLGQGPDLVLVHGWAMCGQAFGQWPARLAQRWRVHLPDLPGHGGSRNVGWDAGEVSNQLAAAMPPGAVWAGWSLGGLLSLAAAPQARPGGLLVMGAGPRFCRGPDWPYGLEPGQVRHMRAGLAVDAARVLREFQALLVAGQEGREAVRALRAVMAAWPAEPAALAAGLDALLTLDLRDRLGQLGVPICWLGGSADPLLDVAALEWAAARSPLGRARVLAGVGHLPFVAEPAVVEAELERLRPRVE